MNASAPSTTYGSGHTCLSTPEFAEASLAFARLAERYGFGFPSLPQSSGQTEQLTRSFSSARTRSASSPDSYKAK